MLKPSALYSEIPEETIEVAQAAFAKGNVYMLMRDELGTVYEDQEFAELYPQKGQPAASPWRLALVTVMQFAENLTDRQAADAVRGRIDWKYALGLSLRDAGFNFSVLCEFRKRLLAGGKESLLFDAFLERFKSKDLLKAGGRQRTDSTHVLAAIHNLNRIELVGQTLQQTLDMLAVFVPHWVQAHLPSEWWQRYSQRIDDYRLPKKTNERQAYAEMIGRDGVFLLNLLDQASVDDEVKHHEKVLQLYRVWQEQYEFSLDGANPLRWREKGQLPCAAERLVSPHDADARYSIKRETEWQGYKVHLTETCQADRPHLITHVETTAATEQDIERLDAIHAALAQHDLLPDEHLLDSAYVSADQLIRSQSLYGIQLIGPTRPDVSWQAQLPDGYDSTHFEIDWQTHSATCPQGRISSYWREQTGLRGNPVIEIMFRSVDCQPCPVRHLCTRSKTARLLTIQPQAQFQALRAARQRQQTDDFKQLYKQRAGIEGTISQATGDLAMRHTRYIGLAKTHLQHLATATAINLQRFWAWSNQIPRSKTRVSPFAALAS